MPSGSVRPGICASCKNNINQRTRPGVQCMGPCSNWFHGECAGVSSEDVAAFKTGELDWMCWLCLPPDLVRSQASTDNAEITVDTPADAARKIRSLESEILKLRADYHDVLRQNIFLEKEINALKFRMAACETNLPIWPLDASGSGLGRNLPSFRRASIGGRSWRWSAPGLAPPAIVEESRESVSTVHASGVSNTTNATIVDGPAAELNAGVADSGAAGVGEPVDGAGVNVACVGGDGGGFVGDAVSGSPPAASFVAAPPAAEVPFRDLVSSTPSLVRRTGMRQNISSVHSLVRQSFEDGRMSGSFGACHPPGVIFERQSSGAQSGNILEGDGFSVRRNNVDSASSAQQAATGDVAIRGDDGGSAGVRRSVDSAGISRVGLARRQPQHRRTKREEENRRRPLISGTNASVPLRGVSVPEGRLEGVRHVFLTGLAPDLTDKELTDYLITLECSATNLVRIKRRNEPTTPKYLSFRFAVPNDKFDAILRQENWPLGVRVKEWFFRGPTSSGPETPIANS
ncbi:hypothetical protein DMENIID0001_013320 [Sergentomyia squamirostris]